MTNLQQVRRYWPKARIQWIDTTSTRFAVPGGRGVWITVYPDGATVTIDTIMSGRFSYSGRTIPEAMRAAGFWVRPLGTTAIYRKGWHELRRDIQIAIGFSPRVSSENHTRLQSRQRPRKGARLGARRRMEAKS